MFKNWKFRLAAVRRYVVRFIAVAMCVASTTSLGENQIQAGLVIGGQAHNDLGQNFDRIRNLLVEGKLEVARSSLDEIVSRSNELPHREVILAGLLIDIGKPGQGRQVLEAFSTQEPLRFDVRLMHCELAVAERRWFEGWLHAQAAEQLRLPEAWSTEYKKTLRTKLSQLKGVCCEGRKDWAGAIQAYRSVDALANRDILAGLARATFFEGKVDDARKCFQELSQRWSDTDLPQVALARLYDSLGKTDQCEQWFRKSLDSDDARVSSARIQFARWLLAHNRPSDVVEVLKDEPSSEEIEVERKYLAALVARMQGRPKDAQRLLAQLHQATPDSFAFGNQLALSLIESEDEASRARALQIADLNARKSPGNPNAWSTLGWVQLQLGDLDRAEECLQKCCRSGLIDRNIAHYLASLLDRKGDAKGALKVRKASEQIPGPFFYAAAN